MKRRLRPTTTATAASPLPTSCSPWKRSRVTHEWALHWAKAGVEQADSEKPGADDVQASSVDCSRGARSCGAVRAVSRS